MASCLKNISSKWKATSSYRIWTLIYDFIFYVDNRYANCVFPSMGHPVNKDLPD